ncbi:DUF115 domain-containing protein [Candidatus Bathyarchaeota archaeon]|nr:MAG: DUF115 domain-containing protein [Candidatus Bathyarchaeota archaeon]
MVFQSEWIRRYLEIAQLMGYQVEKDREATKVLSEIIRSIDTYNLLNELRRTVSNKDVIVFGAGPSLDMHITELKKECPRILKSSVLMAADGATEALLEENMLPHIVVTDLDGRFEAILEAAKRGSLILVHAHGDNIDEVKRKVPKLVQVTFKIVGTTQVEPIYPVQNFGGFTDGDRAVYAAVYFNAKSILLAGMDFGDFVGRRSKPWLSGNAPASETKRRKLQIAKNLITDVAKRFSGKIYTLSEESPRGVEKISTKELNKVFRCSS